MSEIDPTLLAELPESVRGAVVEARNTICAGRPAAQLVFNRVLTKDEQAGVRVVLERRLGVSVKPTTLSAIHPGAPTVWDADGRAVFFNKPYNGPDAH